MRGEWIEIFLACANVFPKSSLPMRGEWIEINALTFMSNKYNVSPHAGRVD